MRRVAGGVWYWMRMLEGSVLKGWSLRRCMGWCLWDTRCFPGLGNRLDIGYWASTESLVRKMG